MEESKTLASQLSDYQQGFKEQVSEEIKDLFEEKSNDLINSGLAKQALGVGDPAPSFDLPNHQGTQSSLNSALQQGPVVLSFYRGGWCPYCNLELRALQQRLDDIGSLGASLIAISPQTPDASLSTVEKAELSFEVLSDIGNQVAKQFGLVFTLDEALRPVYENFGVDLPAHNGDQMFELPIPATYVIDSSGSIRFAFVNADYTLRAEPQDVIDALQKLKN